MASFIPFRRGQSLLPGLVPPPFKLPTPRTWVPTGQPVRGTATGRTNTTNTNTNNTNTVWDPYRRSLFDLQGNLHPDFRQRAAGPPALPFAVRQVGLLGGALEPPVLFPALGSLRFRSRQALGNMTLPDREFYEAGLALQGLSPLNIQEFLRQEEMSTRPASPRYSRFALGLSPFVERRWIP